MYMRKNSQNGGQKISAYKPEQANFKTWLIDTFIVRMWVFAGVMGEYAI